GAATRQNLEQVIAKQQSSSAALDSRKAELNQARASVESHQAALAKARAQLALRQAERQRAETQISSKAAELQAQQKQTAVLNAKDAQLKATLAAKKAALQVAQTNLSYTQILAPIDGIVGERKVQVGQLVSPGTQVISLVESTVWVQANFKETQLK